jgi:hypothetical protein
MNDLSLQHSLNLSLIQKSRVAVLVDGDNISHGELAEIEAKACARIGQRKRNI